MPGRLLLELHPWVQDHHSYLRKRPCQLRAGGTGSFPEAEVWEKVLLRNEGRGLEMLKHPLYDSPQGLL